MWNGVDHEELMRIVEASGLPYVRQVRFTKVTGKNDRRLYVSNAQQVGVVTLYRFTMAGPGFVPLRETKFKIGPHVEQEIDFSLPEEQVLDAFRRAVERIRT